MSDEFRSIISRRRSLAILGGAAATSMICARPGRAQSGQTLRIGMVRPLTGRFASSYAPLFVPARVAAEEINASGGILGRKIEFVEEDDDGSPAKEPAVIRKLQESGLNIVLGPVGTSQALSALPIATAEKIVLASGSFGTEVVDGNRYPYQYQFNYNTSQQSLAVVDFFKKKGAEKIGILYEISGWGESFATELTNRLKAMGSAPVAVESFALTATDLRNQVRSLQRAGVTALAAGCSIVPAAVLALNALKTIAWHPLVVGGNGFHSDSLLDILPPEAMDNVYATFLRTFSYTASKPVDDRRINYVKKLLAYPEVKGQEPNAAVSPFYDFLLVLKSVAESRKGLESETLKQGFDALKDFDGMSGTLSLSPSNHAALPETAVAIVKIISARDPRAMGCFRERAFD